MHDEDPPVPVSDAARGRRAAPEREAADTVVRHAPPIVVGTGPDDDPLPVSQPVAEEPTAAEEGSGTEATQAEPGDDVPAEAESQFEAQVEAQAEAGPSVAVADDVRAVRENLATLTAQTVAVNQILDRMHADNERLRRGENERLLDPVFRDLVKMLDDWSSMARAWRKRADATPGDVAARCDEVADDVTLLLERYGVETVEPADGEPFDRKLHRAVATVPAEEEPAVRTVASTRRPGFVVGGRVLRFAEVVVYQAAPGN